MDFADKVKKAALRAEPFKYNGAHTVYVVPGNFEPRLPLCVGYLKGDVFLSEFIPDGFRKAVIIHELTCVPNFGHPGHCVNALHVDIGYVQLDLRPLYFEFRRRFFDDLLEYFKEKPPAFYGELERSRAEIERLLVSGAPNIPYIG
jgi:hypothetical protein